MATRPTPSARRLVTRVRQGNVRAQVSVLEPGNGERLSQ
jgi:hypothetical protein